MLSAIASALGGQIVDSLLGKITGIFQAYFNKQITEAQLRAQLLTALVETFGEIEKAHADVLAKTYATFMDAMKTSRLMQVMWAWTVGTQLFVLVWSQFFVPCCSHMGSCRAGRRGQRGSGPICCSAPALAWDRWCCGTGPGRCPPIG
jgi:hypothetical protein